MKSLSKRISKLEAFTPKERGMNLGELMEAERTPGTPEYEGFQNLYDENRYEKSK